MEDKITREKLEKYFQITEKAFVEAEKNVAKEKKEEAQEILRMVSCYISDAKYFEKNGNFVNAFASLNYAHGWLDSGARLGVFNVKNTDLFTVK